MWARWRNEAFLHLVSKCHRMQKMSRLISYTDAVSSNDTTFAIHFAAYESRLLIKTRLVVRWATFSTSSSAILCCCRLASFPLLCNTTRRHGVSVRHFSRIFPMDRHNNTLALINELCERLITWIYDNLYWKQVLIILQYIYKTYLHNLHSSHNIISLKSLHLEGLHLNLLKRLCVELPILVGSDNLGCWNSGVVFLLVSKLDISELPSSNMSYMQLYSITAILRSKL